MSAEDPDLAATPAASVEYKPPPASCMTWVSKIKVAKKTAKNPADSTRKIGAIFWKRYISGQIFISLAYLILFQKLINCKIL